MFLDFTAPFGLGFACERRHDMNVLVVNGSPRGAEGNTDVIARAFLDGACEAGAQAETVYLKDKKINHCTGCFACWTRTPGVCIHKDDMPELLEKMRWADCIVFATPLYVYTVSGLMKDFMDRVIPSVQPFIDVENGLSNHPSRYPKAKSIVLISNAGFPEQAHFSGLKETFRACFRSEEKPLAGMICCAAGPMLGVPELRPNCEWYLDAARLAGREVVEQGRIAAETQATLDRPLVDDPEMYAQVVNANWESMGLTRI